MSRDRPDLYYDAFNLLCGEKIGSGMTREVFTCNIDAKFVVKVEATEVRTHFQNMMEWFVWKRVVGTPFEKWFAPVHEISPDGRLLIMHRTKPLTDAVLPEKLPSFFTDFKPNNYGILKGCVVCHDYGSHLLMEQGMTTRLKKVDWTRFMS